MLSDQLVASPLWSALVYGFLSLGTLVYVVAASFYVYTLVKLSLGLIHGTMVFMYHQMKHTRQDGEQHGETQDE